MSRRLHVPHPAGAEIKSVRAVGFPPEKWWSWRCQSCGQTSVPSTCKTERSAVLGFGSHVCVGQMAEATQ